MNNNTVNYYPGILQSLGIVGIAVLLMIGLSPINILLNNLIGKELSFLVYYLLSFGGTFGITHWLRKRNTNEKSYDLSLSSIKLMALVSITIVAIQFGITAPVVNSIYMPDFMKELMLELAAQNGVFSFITIVIAAPVLEELIFRGIILDGFLRKYSPLKSIVISSILFGIVHLNPWQFISALILGIFSGWIYYKTRKLSLSILIHSVNNLIGFISFYFIDMDTMMTGSLSEQYGGVTNLILVVVGGIILTILGIALSRKEIKRLTFN